MEFCEIQIIEYEGETPTYQGNRILTLPDLNQYIEDKDKKYSVSYTYRGLKWEEGKYTVRCYFKGYR